MQGRAMCRRCALDEKSDVASCFGKKRGGQKGRDIRQPHKALPTASPIPDQQSYRLDILRGRRLEHLDQSNQEGCKTNDDLPFWITGESPICFALRGVERSYEILWCEAELPLDEVTNRQ